MTTAIKTKWNIDPRHSEVQFKVKHLAISNVSGTFKIFKGDVISNCDDFNNAQINLAIDANSIDTNNPDRDNHLKSPDFFNTSTFPELLFTGQLQKENEAYALTGDLTIVGVTKSVKLAAELTGTGTGRFGDTRTGFEITGKINRKDFGLTWNILADGGGLVVGDEIKLHFDIQVIKE